MVASKKRVLRKSSIDLMHQVKRCGIKADCHAFNHLHPLEDLCIIDGSRRF
jgi:hypothetical protein